MVYDIRAIQLRELEILKAFDAICEARGLRYFLVGGTLIGAMRHNGFIPWDDDIDIGMPPDDYKRLEELGSSIWPDKFSYIPEDSTGTWLGCAKVCDGEYSIDIFPFESKPNLPYSIVRYFFRFRHGCYWRLRMANKSISRKDIEKWDLAHKFSVLIWKILCFIFPFGGWHMRPEAGFSNHARKCQYVPVQSHVFEDMEFPIPADFDAVLASEYEDWRELPPEEDRVPSHVDKFDV